MGEEEKKPVEESKAAEEGKKEEAPKAAEEGKEEKKLEEAKAEPPQEIVLKVFMHCEGCARKVRRCLKGFEGVEDVITDCKTSKVVVKGEKADPVKVFERVQRKSHRQVELISPIPKPPPPEEPEKPPEKEVKPEEKKVEPPVITVVLGVYMHCDACAQEIRKRILRMKGVESAEADLKNSQVTVKGVVDPKTLTDHVYKKTGKHASIVKVVEPEKKEEEKPKEEKKAEAKKEEVAAAAAAKEGGEEVVVELRKNEMYYYYPQNYPQSYQQQRYGYGQEMNVAPQMFSDENPNACVVM